MKFTDGNWLIRKGFEISSPVELHKVDVDHDSITVYAPCRHIAHRGDTLQGPLLTVRFSSPMADVIRVQVYHFKGTRRLGPNFAVHGDASVQAVISHSEEAATLTTGDLSVRIDKKPAGWSIGFFNGEKRITGSGPKGIGYITAASDGTSYMCEQLDLGVGEKDLPLLSRTGRLWKSRTGTEEPAPSRHIRTSPSISPIRAVGCL